MILDFLQPLGRSTCVSLDAGYGFMDRALLFLLLGEQALDQLLKPGIGLGATDYLKSL